MQTLSLTFASSLHRFRRPWIVAGLISLSSANLAAAELSDRHEYDIQAGSLAAALNQFAAQTGIFLSSQSAQLSGKKTNGYQGSSSGIEALNNLLQGSGLTFQETESGDVVITSALSGNNLTLSPLLIESTREVPPAGQNTLSKEEIDSMAGTTGSMTSLLRNNSSVQYSRSSNLSANAATLRPEEISIHGQASYQNAYIIDGATVNSDMNPGDNEDTFTNPITPANLSMLGGGSSQAYYIDPDAISKVTVLDHNISAEYGGFTGGVVNTELLRYQEEEFTTLKYGISGSDLNTQHVDNDTEEDYEEGKSYDGSYTPDYLKQRVSLTSIQELNNDYSGGIQITRRQSDFEQVYKDNAGRGQLKKPNYTDRIDNVLGRLDYHYSDRLDLGFSGRFSDRTYNGVTSTSYDAPFERIHEAYGIGTEAIYSADTGTFTAEFSADRFTDALDSTASYSAYHPTAAYDGSTHYQGGYGDVIQQQDSVSAKLKWEHDPIFWGATLHRLSTGLQLSQINAFYETKSPIINELYRCRSGSASAGCDDVNNDGKHDSADEYLRTRSVVEQNKLSRDYQNYAVFLEDSITKGRWTTTLGVRADHDSLLGNTNLSPRAKVEWDTFGDQSTIITAGANRYYGRSFLRYAVNDTLRSWRTQTTYDESGNITKIRQYEDRSVQDFDLKTPYSDELSLSWVQKIGHMEATLKGITRSTKDGVQRLRNDDGQYLYTNTGKREHDSLTLQLETLEAFELGNTQTYIDAYIGYSDSTSNSQSDEAYDQTSEKEAIYYEGQIIYNDNLPSWDYSIPFNFGFSTKTLIPAWHLLWSNQLNLHAGGKVAKDSYDNIEINGQEYDIYENVKFDRYATLDTSFTWTPPIIQSLDGYFNIGVRNIFDKVIDVSTKNNGNSYTVGRSVSLEVGMRF